MASSNAGNVSLAFRIMRLSPPRLPDNSLSQFDVLEDMETTPSVRADSLPLDHPFAGRLHRPLDEREGPAATLATPEAFGPVYLGQKFRAWVVLCNLAPYPLTGVSVTVELHTERGATLLHDPRGTPALTLPAGASHSVQVVHDIKDIGSHSLVCSAIGVGEHSSRQTHSQSFRFPVTNPIIVRSKQRVVDDTVLLEVVLESAVNHPFFLTRHVFLPHNPFVVEEVVAAPKDSSGLGPLRSTLAQYPLLAPRGGQYGLVYRLKAQQSEIGPRSPTGAAQDPNALVPLGRLDLEWTGPMGEISRLQTQSISMSRSLLPRKSGDISLRLAGLSPPRLTQEAPFFVRLEVSNAGRRLTGPLLAAWQGVATRGAIVASGCHTVSVPALAPGEHRTVSLRLLPLMAGQQAVTGLMLTDERTGNVLDRLPPQEVFVHPG